MKTNKILLVSPRKSGTHLITNILESLGLTFKGKLEIGSDETGYYSISSTFHTSFNKTFHKLDRDTFDGGKLLPLKSSIGIIITRHPLDIFYSDMNFSFESENTSYSNLALTSDDDKIEHIYENAFYQNYFYELFNYCAWSKFDNFITISFEELVECIKTKNLIKSPGLIKLLKILDIKIDKLDEKVASASPTLNKGEINLGASYILSNYPKIADDKFLLKYCEYYGYKKDEASIPSNLKYINENDLELNDTRPHNIPILVKRNLENQNIIYYNKKLYSIPENINFNKILKYLKFLKNFKSYEGAKSECYSNSLIKSLKFKIIKLICGF